MSTDFAERVFPVFADPVIKQAEESASRRGYAAGFAAGARAAQVDAERLREQLRAEHAEQIATMAAGSERALAALSQAARSLTERTVPSVEEAQQTVADIALDLAESIIGFHVSDQAAAARAALARATVQADGAEVVVRMNPADIDTLREIDALPADVEVTPDPSIQPGDAVGELEHGFIDARLAAALARARFELTAALSGAGS